MTQRDALHAAVLAEPAADLPRLVFADWCDDHDEPDRAEFIRIQLELSRLTADDPLRGALKDREKELLDDGHDRWKVPGIRGVQGFARGFVESWDGTAEWLLAAAARLFELAPVRSVRIRNTDQYVGRLTQLRGFAQVEELDLSGNTLAAGNKLGRLLNETPLGRLRTLRVGNNRLFADAVPQIAESPVATQLSTLDLSGNPLSDDGMETLAMTARLNGLQSLVLRNNEQGCEDSIHATGAEMLARSRAFPHLEQLDLTGHRVGEVGLYALIGSPIVANLQELRLARNDIGEADDQWAWRLIRAPLTPSLRWLDLSGLRNQINPSAAEQLAGWSRLGAGLTLDLRGCRMNSEAHAILAASPYQQTLLLDTQPPEDAA